MTLVGSLLIAVLALLVDFLLGLAERRIHVRDKAVKRKNKIAAGIAGILILCVMIGILIPKPEDKVIHIATKPMTNSTSSGTC